MKDLELTPYDMEQKLISIGFDADLLGTYSSRRIVELYLEEFELLKDEELEKEVNAYFTKQS